MSEPGRAVDAALDRWCELDHAGAFLSEDRDAIEASRALRAVIVELLVLEPEPTARDLLHALAALGRVTAEQNGSPTLAASTIDRLLEALESTRARPHGPDLTPFAVSARAAVVESFVLAIGVALRGDAARAWEYPKCVVPLRPGVVAIAANPPADDAESLTAWASRIAHALSVAGVRGAVVAGSEAAVLALDEALDLAGVARLDRDDAASEGHVDSRHRTGR